MKYALVLFLLTTSSDSFAKFIGNDSGGGGGAVVCRNGTGGIISADLLDLYEARSLGVLRKSTGDVREDYVRYLEFRSEIETGNRTSLGKAQRDQAIDMWEKSLRRFHFTSQGEHPQQTNDFGPLPSLPRGCFFEQVAHFDDSKIELNIDGEIWDYWVANDPIQTVALMAHEMYYRRYRMAGEENSVAVRKVVGPLFLKEPLKTVIDGVTKQDLRCSTIEKQGTNTLAFVIRKNKAGAILQFSELFGRTTLWPVKIQVPEEIELSDFNLTEYDGMLVNSVKDSINGDFELLDSPFAGYRLHLTFHRGKPFLISLLKQNGQFLRSIVVNDCK